LRYWEITTDIETLPENSTWYVMTQIPGVLAKEVGNLYGNRTWIEYGFRQSKSELGWADFRVPQYSQIEKWWEIVWGASQFWEYVCQKRVKIKKLLKS